MEGEINEGLFDLLQWMISRICGTKQVEYALGKSFLEMPQGVDPPSDNTVPLCPLYTNSGFGVYDNGEFTGFRWGMFIL